MNFEILTKEDLQEFRRQLLDDLKKAFPSPTEPQGKAWLKSSEVKTLLNISSNTLQGLRVNGRLHPTKLGGIYYYSLQEINALLEQRGPS